MFVSKKIYLTIIILCIAGLVQAQSTDEFNLDEVYHIDPDGTISLDSDDAEVTIIGSDRSDVHVEIHYKLDVTGFSFGDRTKFDMQVRERSGDLVIEEQPRDFSGVTFGSTDEDYTIRIEAPRGVSLDLNGDDENYKINSINGDIGIQADDADARLQACGGRNFDFDLDDGQIEMDEGRGSLSIDVDDGQAEIQNSAFESIDLDSDDGDFWIQSSWANGGSYNFDMDDGDLELEVRAGGGTVNIRHDDADISVGSVFRQTLDEENEAEYKLPGGTAMVRIDVDDADIELHKVN